MTKIFDSGIASLALVLGLGGIAGLGACTDDDGPAGAAAVDPTGDTFGDGSYRPDLTSMSASPGEGLTVTLEFSEPITAAGPDGRNLIAGYIDLDVDQAAPTGVAARTDEVRDDAASTGLGIEYAVSLFEEDDGTMIVYGLDGEVGRIAPIYTDTRIIVTVPLAMIGNDDGNVNLSAVIGTEEEPTDLVPNTGHLALGTPVAPANARLAVRRADGARRATAWPR